MANISIAGSVCKGKDDSSPVRFQVLDSGTAVANFSVADTEYFSFRGDERPGQFYSVQVFGKTAEFSRERLKRGSKVSVSGQLVLEPASEGDRIFPTIKNARVQFLDPREEEREEPPF